MSVTAIITTYNRFKYLKNAIDSVRKQTYTPSQIVVVNDGSNQEEYYTQSFGSDVTVVHLSKNTREIFGIKIPGGIQRNIGVMLAKTKYVAFLDDDDVWLPQKLELQLDALNKSQTRMSCTEGFSGYGAYNAELQYPLYNAEVHLETLRKIYSGTEWLKFGLPSIFSLDFLRIHNCCIASSVLVSRELLIQVGLFRAQSYADDYECWLRLLKFTDCAYVTTPCVYYDNGHGDGKQY